jgi:hypothetical protein
MTRDWPIFDRDDQGRLRPAQTADDAGPQDRAARRVAATLASIARATERMERTQAAMCATTELITISREALRRSRDILAGCRQGQFPPARQERP